MGPSGAGKDSIMKWMESHPRQGLTARRINRYVTRQTLVDQGTDRYVSDEEFDALVKNDDLAMHWSAHDFKYGIKACDLKSKHDHEFLLINGSRAYFSIAQSLFTNLVGIHVLANQATLEQRLLSRARESVESISNRLHRNEHVQALNQGAWIDVQNDGKLEESAQWVWDHLLRIAQRS